MVNTTLADLAETLEAVKVDGERADALEPKHNTLLNSEGYITATEIARDSGISPDSPKYSGMHQHCQYSRTC